MIPTKYVASPNILTGLRIDGFVVLNNHLPNLSTVQVAEDLGTIVEMDRILASSGISSVQPLSPREGARAKKNRYSGHYGLDPFPLHTDLAHWALPPHYLLLRCLVGTENVFTTLLPCADVIVEVGTSVLQKAVLRARKSRSGNSGLVRAMSSYRGETIFRWDPIFLKPLNGHAQVLKIAMSAPRRNEAMTRILLKNPGDTLLVDNWRMLHGRSRVPAASAARLIERVYLSEMFDER